MVRKIDRATRHPVAQRVVTLCAAAEVTTQKLSRKQSTVAVNSNGVAKSSARHVQSLRMNIPVKRWMMSTARGRELYEE